MSRSQKVIDQMQGCVTISVGRVRPGLVVLMVTVPTEAEADT